MEVVQNKEIQLYKHEIDLGGRVTVYARDVFLSHAGPDKDTHARPLERALRHLGISTWLDEAQLEDGDSLVDNIGLGLDRATFVLLIITPTFLERNWPQAELRNALAREISSGIPRVIPILDAPSEAVFERYPLLVDKVYRRWSDGGPEAIAARLFTRLGRTACEWHAGLHPTEYTGPTWVRITPAQDGRNRQHHVTILWGIYKFEGDFEVGTEPISLLHHKTRADGIPLQIRVSPSAIVTVGQGPAPDADSYNIDEGWIRLSGVPIVS